MAKNKEKLSNIFKKTSGMCHLCHKKLVLKNHGEIGARGAWEVEHSKPKSKNGTDHMNNLYPACISCNRSKGNGTNYSVRSKNGVRNAPLSMKKRKRMAYGNIIIGAVSGAYVGRFFGPTGFLVGGTIGAVFGSELKVDK